MFNAREPATSLCIGCDYPLHSLDPQTCKCPECGRDFDPDNRATTNRVRPLGSLRRRVVAPPGWLHPTGRAALCGVLLYSVLLAGAPIVSLVVLAWVYVVIGSIAYVQRVARRFIVSRFRLHRKLLDVDAVLIERTHNAFALAAALLIFRVPFFLAFFVSYPFLSRAAYREYHELPMIRPHPSSMLVGVFPCREVVVNLDSVHFNLFLGGSIIYYEQMSGQRGWTASCANDPLTGFPW